MLLMIFISNSSFMLLYAGGSLLWTAIPRNVIATASLQWFGVLGADFLLTGIPRNLLAAVGRHCLGLLDHDGDVVSCGSTYPFTL